MKRLTKIFLGIITVLFLFQNVFAATEKLLNQKEKMTARIIRYEVKKEYQTEFQKAISDYVQESLLNNHNIMSEAYFEQENQSVIWLFERWNDKNELQKFSNNLKSKILIEALKKALVKPEEIIDVKDLEPISKQEWRKRSRAEDKQLTIMLFVDAKAGTEDDFKKIYHKAMPEFRSEAGVVTYQLSEFENDKTKFVTFEKFRSQDAFQFHLNFPPIQPVIDYLNTSIKKQPFQTGIHNLIEFAPLIRE